MNLWRTPLIPGPRQEVQELVRSHIRQEQVEEEQAQPDLGQQNARFKHDPLWNRRFWSIQHVHDCIEGKTFHWFWSPMAEIFDLAQIMFMLTPVLMYLKGGGTLSIRDLILWVLLFKCLIIAARRTLEWYHNWSFMHAWKKAQQRRS